MMKTAFGLFATLATVAAFMFSSCDSNSSDDIMDGANPPQAGQTSLPTSCEIAPNGDEPVGTTPLQVEKLVTGLTVPWAIGFISSTDFLVTERTGDVRLVRNGVVEPQPVLNLERTSSRAEGGLLGLAIDPQFAKNRFFYVYYTASRLEGGEENRVERYKLADDAQSATFDREIITGIPAGVFHDGGRLKFGPDGNLYVGTGDSRSPELSQDPDSTAGKILRLRPDGSIPPDNPIPGNPIFVLGVRNMQAFDWIDNATLVVADHGPTGELGRAGHDEVSFAKSGNNLGWPAAWKCDDVAGMARPFLVWQRAVPPGGLVFFTGAAIPEWRGNVLIASLGSEHLHRIVFTNGGTSIQHEVYLKNTYGRLREITQAPDGSLLITTSNCDGRGSCGSERDMILRVTKAN